MWGFLGLPQYIPENEEVVMVGNLKSVIVEVLEKNVAGLQMSDESMQLTLTELGVDSLDVMLIFMDIQERTGVQIPEDQLDRLKTPAQIVAFLEVGV